MDTIKDIFVHPSRYAKFYVALAAPLSALVFALAPQGENGIVEAAFVLTVGEWYSILVAFAVSVGVYQTPNKKV